MQSVVVNNLTFNEYLSEQEIASIVKNVAERINADYAGKEPLFICVLNGAFMFASDLLKRVELPAQLSFVKVSSYSGTSSTGNVKELIGLNEDVKGRTVVIIEDIVDSGRTMFGMVEYLKSLEVGELHIATLFFKPDALKYNLNIEYVAMVIPNDFIVGYGLDYDGYGRNLRDIYTLIQE